MNTNVQRVAATETDMAEHKIAHATFYCLLEMAKQENKPLYVLTLQKTRTPLERFLNRKDFLLLKADKGIRDYNKVIWQSKSTMNLRSNAYILCLYYDISDLEKVDDKVMDNSVIVVIEWEKNDCKAWLDRWNNDEGIKKNWSSDFPETIYKGLYILSFRINKKSHNSFDDEKIRTTIRVIHKYAPDVSLSKVKDVLIAEMNWNSKYADEFVDLLGGLRIGKHFRGGIKTGLKNEYQSWSSFPIPQK